MGQRVYLETTVVSYLTAWRSPQLLMAAHQEATRKWWDEERTKFEVFVSEIVILEASGGDPDAAARRLAAIEGIPELPMTGPTYQLAQTLVDQMICTPLELFEKSDEE